MMNKNDKAKKERWLTQKKFAYFFFYEDVFSCFSFNEMEILVR